LALQGVGKEDPVRRGVGTPATVQCAERRIH
jgi:hypothetical protein